MGQGGRCCISFTSAFARVRRSSVRWRLTQEVRQALCLLEAADILLSGVGSEAPGLVAMPVGDEDPSFYSDMVGWHCSS